MTKPQIWLIKRFTSNITVLYDGDAAGIHAALRGIDMFLEAGFNVKVVLLPDGEDPDSYAQSHDSTEFIQYIEEHKTDFIRFKAALLSKEAGDDPYKRAELIKDITSSIAIIPDMITRQVYIKDCAERLHMSEKVLTTEVVNLRKKNREENAKKAEHEQAMKTETAEQPAVTPQEAKAPLSAAPESPLEQNLYNLMQLVVRYGEQPIEIDDTIYSIGEVIVYTIENDEIAIPKLVYKTMMDEFKLHYKDEGFVAEQFFKFHPDPQVSTMAIDMIADKYRFAKPDNTMQMGELVTRLLYEIKLTAINMQIEELEAELKEAQQTNNWERQMQLLAQQPELLSQRNEICKILGNRVISA